MGNLLSDTHRDVSGTGLSLSPAPCAEKVHHGRHGSRRRSKRIPITSLSDAVLILVSGNMICAIIFFLVFYNLQVFSYYLWPMFWALICSLALWNIKQALVERVNNALRSDQWAVIHFMTQIVTDVYVSLFEEPLQAGVNAFFRFVSAQSFIDSEQIAHSNKADSAESKSDGINTKAESFTQKSENNFIQKLKKNSQIHAESNKHRVTSSNQSDLDVSINTTHTQRHHRMETPIVSSNKSSHMGPVTRALQRNRKKNDVARDTRNDEPTRHDSLNPDNAYGFKSLEESNLTSISTTSGKTTDGDTNASGRGTWWKVLFAGYFCRIVSSNWSLTLYIVVGSLLLWSIHWIFTAYDMSGCGRRIYQSFSVPDRLRRSNRCLQSPECLKWLRKLCHTRVCWYIQRGCCVVYFYISRCVWYFFSTLFVSTHTRKSYIDRCRTRSAQTALRYTDCCVASCLMTILMVGGFLFFVLFGLQCTLETYTFVSDTQHTLGQHMGVILDGSDAFKQIWVGQLSNDNDFMKNGTNVLSRSSMRNIPYRPDNETLSTSSEWLFGSSMHDVVDTVLDWLGSSWPNETSMAREVWTLFKEFNETVLNRPNYHIDSNQMPLEVDATDLSTNSFGFSSKDEAKHYFDNSQQTHLITKHEIFKHDKSFNSPKYLNGTTMNETHCEQTVCQEKYDNNCLSDVQKGLKSIDSDTWSDYTNIHPLDQTTLDSDQNCKADSLVANVQHENDQDIRSKPSVSSLDNSNTKQSRQPVTSRLPGTLASVESGSSYSPNSIAKFSEFKLPQPAPVVTRPSPNPTLYEAQATKSSPKPKPLIDQKLDTYPSKPVLNTPSVSKTVNMKPSSILPNRYVNRIVSSQNKKFTTVQTHQGEDVPIGCVIDPSLPLSPSLTSAQFWMRFLRQVVYKPSLLHPQCWVHVSRAVEMQREDKNSTLSLQNDNNLGWFFGGVSNMFQSNSTHNKPMEARSQHRTSVGERAMNTITLLPFPGWPQMMRGLSNAALYVSGAVTLLARHVVAATASVTQFVLSFVLFVSFLFYLLSAPTDWMWSIFDFLEEDDRATVRDVMANSVRQVFVITIKISLYHGLFTWIIFSFFEAPFAYTSTLLSMLSAVIPFMPNWLVAAPAAIVLMVSRGFVISMIFWGAHHFWLWYGDSYFYEEMQQVHFYIVALSILGGFSSLGFQGAVIGPLLVSIVNACYQLYKQKYSQSRESAMSTPAPHKTRSPILAPRKATSVPVVSTLMDSKGNQVTDKIELMSVQRPTELSTHGESMPTMYVPMYVDPVTGQPFIPQEIDQQAMHPQVRNRSTEDYVNGSIPYNMNTIQNGMLPPTGQSTSRCNKNASINYDKHGRISNHIAMPATSSSEVESFRGTSSTHRHRVSFEDNNDIHNEASYNSNPDHTASVNSTTNVDVSTGVRHVHAHATTNNDVSAPIHPVVMMPVYANRTSQPMGNQPVRYIQTSQFPRMVYSPTNISHKYGQLSSSQTNGYTTHEDSAFDMNTTDDMKDYTLDQSMMSILSEIPSRQLTYSNASYPRSLILRNKQSINATGYGTTMPYTSESYPNNSSVKHRQGMEGQNECSNTQIRSVMSPSASVTDVSAASAPLTSALRHEHNGVCFKENVGQENNTKSSNYSVELSNTPTLETRKSTLNLSRRPQLQQCQRQDETMLNQHISNHNLGKAELSDHLNSSKVTSTSKSRFDGHLSSYSNSPAVYLQEGKSPTVDDVTSGTFMASPEYFIDGSPLHDSHLESSRTMEHQNHTPARSKIYFNGTYYTPVTMLDKVSQERISVGISPYSSRREIHQASIMPLVLHTTDGVTIVQKETETLNNKGESKLCQDTEIEHDTTNSCRTPSRQSHLCSSKVQMESTQSSIQEISSSSSSSSSITNLHERPRAETEGAIQLLQQSHDGKNSAYKNRRASAGYMKSVSKSHDRHQSESAIHNTFTTPEMNDKNEWTPISSARRRRRARTNTSAISFNL